MKAMLVGAVLAVGSASVAHGDDAASVPALGDLRIVLIEGLERFQRIDLGAISAQSCLASSAMDSLRIVECGLPSSTRFDVRLPDGTMSGFALDKLTYFDQAASGGARKHEYHYSGPWTRTVDGVTLTATARLVLALDTRRPTDIRGFLQLDGYDLKWPLQAQTATP
jgi:hypothetical protein